MTNFKNLSILYVEDDFEVQANISKILSLLFQKVYTASNGAEALEIFKENEIHMILTDYEMPNLNGYELIVKIRELSETIPIVILSNHTEKEKLLKCIPLKLMQYLEKPIIYEKLFQVLYECKKEVEKYTNIKHIINETTSYDPNVKLLFVNDKKIELTALEIEVFEYLFNKKNQLVMKEELIAFIWKEQNHGEDALKNLIYRLRKKIGKELIENHKNLGYSLKSN
ncbi:response regulator transcription factor [Arcobacter defluvii]|uniref:Two-component system response regulator n=1 Tax=Arcobacter defluvii TaxID=873191 RepID=A0AAE7BHE3_9BACT|nr:response regulator transcription factor [Arcobacter defluvii]QKF77769.1 two-component system response regulator [Arcobacter defluvii]RXI34260.1 DNA-binding response regulator [Arcobacter defluvii]